MSRNTLLNQLEASIDCIASNSLTEDDSEAIGKQLAACCSTVASGAAVGAQEFSQAARVLSCMQKIAVGLSNDVGQAGGISVAVVASILMSNAMPAAVAMLTRLTPKHRHFSPRGKGHSSDAPCACCRPDAPAWSHVVMVTTADGTQRRLSVSHVLTHLSDQLLTAVLALQAWVEQGVKEADGDAGAATSVDRNTPSPCAASEQESQEHEDSQHTRVCLSDKTSPAGLAHSASAAITTAITAAASKSKSNLASPTVQPDGTKGVRQYLGELSALRPGERKWVTHEVLHEFLTLILKGTSNDHQQSCSSLAFQLREACASELSELARHYANTSLPKILSFWKGFSPRVLGQDRMWLCMRRSGLVLSQVSLGELDDDVRFNHAITMMVSTATLCSTLAEALQSSIKDKVKPLPPPVAAQLLPAAHQLRTAVFITESCAKTINNFRSSDILKEVSASLYCASYQLIIVAVPAAIKHPSLREDLHTLAAAVLQVLRMGVQGTAHARLVSPATLTRELMHTLEYISFHGLGTAAGSDSSTGASAGQGGAAGAAGIPMLEHPSPRTCALLLLCSPLGNLRLDQHIVDVSTLTQLARQLLQHLPGHCDLITNKLRARKALAGLSGPPPASNPGGGEAGNAAAGAAAAAPAPDPICPEDCCLVLMSAWALCAASSKLDIPQEALPLLQASVRLHHAVMDAYTLAGLGAEGDAWRAAMMGTGHLDNIMRVVAWNEDGSHVVGPSGVIIGPFIMAVCPWSMPVVAASLLQQVVARLKPPSQGAPSGSAKIEGQADPNAPKGLSRTHATVGAKPALFGRVKTYLHLTLVCEGLHVFVGMLRGLTALAPLPLLCVPSSVLPEAEAQHQHPLAHEVRAVCADVLNHMGKGNTAEVDLGNRYSLVMLLQVAEWLPRIGKALAVAADISEGVGIDLDDQLRSEVDDSGLAMVLMGLPLSLPHVLECWAVVCEGGAPVSDQEYVEGVLPSQLRDVLACAFPGCAARCDSSGGSGDGCSNNISAHVGQGEATKVKSKQAAGNAGGSAAGGSSAAGNHAAEVAGTRPLLIRCLSDFAESRGDVQLAISCLHTLLGQVDAVFGAAVPKVHNERRRNARPRTPHPVTFARNRLVRCLLAWSGERCARAVARIEAACDTAGRGGDSRDGGPSASG